MDNLSYRLRKFRAFLWQNSEPVTRTIVLLVALVFLLNFLFFLGTGFIPGLLAYSTTDVITTPWTLITYPLVTQSPFELLFAGYWLWIVGSTLERSWSSKVYLRFFIVVTMIPALALCLGSLLLGELSLGFLGSTHAALSGLWMPLAALTVAWTLLNPEQVVLLGFLLPIKGRYLMWITITLAYFFFAFRWNAPWLGFFVLSGVGYAYIFTRQKVASPYLKSERLYRKGPPTLVERISDWVSYYWRQLLRKLPRR